MAVSKRLRYEVLRRDQNTCHYCGGKAPEVTLTVDHVLPVALGGSDDANNLVAACKACNAGKTSSSPGAPLVAQVDELAGRYAAALHTVVEKRTAQFAAEEGHLDSFDQTWRGWPGYAGNPIYRDDNWEDSVLRFLAAGLSSEFLARAVRTSMNNRQIGKPDKWRYFCGICHKEIKAITNEAAALASASDASSDDPLDEHRINGMPQGPGLDYRFDSLHLSENFIADLLEHVGAPDSVLALATQGYWNAMAKSYMFFLGDPDRYFDDEEGELSEEFSSHSAWFMHHIQLACRGELVPDGS